MSQIDASTLPSIDMVSDHACLLTFSQVINETVSNRIAQLTHHLKRLNGVVDLVPSYTTLLVVFDGDHYDRFAIIKAIRHVITNIDPNEPLQTDCREIVIPVYYGKEVGPDLSDVSNHCQLTEEEIIQRHSETIYRAYAVGFTPGFAFLGNTPNELHIPRKNTPRLKVPIGSVAIAENQTAVYPSVTPGGWQIIGRTPLNLIDWGSENLALIAMGDSVRFEPISRDEFLVLGGQLDGF
ncbi:5-oxoprolinase subunit PxpB [Marinomonas transparens]|uniref:5-oxoprolinase subunit PxpB n=1 Tax=Marinomonas transparens TaxID=2795388 RepID=A0A934JHZ5_9GAMM|nr:5-oxoprolinase subunit PxpB [Marinomonas transparens]MBJ7536116.1 5-oxoprolinase subunit PxpB [Marinomonas transparens]